MSSSEDETGGSPTGAVIALKLDENLKVKLQRDLASICDLNEAEARAMLETHKWNIQAAIDAFLDHSGDEEEAGVSSESEADDVVLLEDPKDVEQGVSIDQAESETETNPIDVDGAVESGTTATATGPSSRTARVTSDLTGTSTLAPETFSVMSWNLDGLDDKNLEKRMEAVVKLIEKENHGVVFFQELIPYTFQYIAHRLSSKYFAVVGTEDSRSEYFTATFLRLNHVIYDDHYIIPYENTAMGRNLLVTKAFSGRAKLFLLNSHLESTAEFSEQRKTQLGMCFNHCTSIPAEYNVIFGGDLNLRDKEVGGSLPANMSDLWIKCGSRETSRYTWDLTRNTNKQMPSRFQPRLRFDRLYFRDSVPKTLTPEFFGVTGIEKVVGTQSFPSDHWAIISFFRLTEDARKPNGHGTKRKGGDQLCIDLD